MLFQNTRQHMSSTSSSAATMSINMLQPTRFRPMLSRSQSTIPIQVPEPKPKTMVWGEPTWFLFHTLAEKVKLDSFPKIKNELTSMIVRICNNLPCPDCTNHATRYLQGINLSTIQTKTDLIEMLWRFHNVVNHRKNYEIFPLNKMSSKYSLANTNKIIQNFLYHYDKRGYSMRAGTDGFHRTRMVNDFKNWIRTNIHHFDP